MSDNKKCVKISVYDDDCTLLGYVFSYTPYYNERLAKRLWEFNGIIADELGYAPFDEYELEQYQDTHVEEY